MRHRIGYRAIARRRRRAWMNAGIALLCFAAVALLWVYGEQVDLFLNNLIKSVLR